MVVNDAFVESDKFRRAVFTEIAAGETDIEFIAKKHRLVKPAAERAVNDLVEHGLVEKGDEGYALTAEGERFEADRKKRDLRS